MEVDQRTHLSVQLERATLVGLQLTDGDFDAVESLKELQALAESAGAIVVDMMVQKRDRIDPQLYLGRGKIEELAGRVAAHDADIIIFDDDLSPAQIREIESACRCMVIDRSELILDIFANRARTHEARLQVELAQLEYTAPRLRGMWTHLERIAGAGGGTGAGNVGGIGTRGPGERQIEIDRRIVNRRVTQLKRQIKRIDRRKVREVQARSDYFNVSLVGYTNAGKSSLMNALTDAEVPAEDRLFATLDTRTRRWDLGGGDVALLSDTVGFVSRLPHHLVASFRATLEEAIHADLLLHVVDAATPKSWQQYEAVTSVLEDLGCKGHRTLVLLNKMDCVEDQAAVQVLESKLADALPVSAHTRTGLDQLAERVREMVSGSPREFTVRLPVHSGKAISFVEQHAQVQSRAYDSESVEMEIVAGTGMVSRLQQRFPELQIIEPE